MKPHVAKLVALIFEAGADGISVAALRERTGAKRVDTDLSADIRKRCGLTCIGGGPATRWVLAEHAADLRARMDAAAKERMRAYWARRQREIRAGQREAAEIATEALLAPRRPRFVAGSVPPPVTFAARTVFEWRGAHQ